jgi:hypothetical protein
MTIEEILGNLRRGEHGTPIRNQIETWVNKADFKQLKTLTQILSDNFPKSLQEEWRFVDVHYQILDGLVVQAEQSHIRALLDILSIPIPKQHIRTNTNQIAAKLAAFQTPEQLDALAKDFSEQHFGLFATLVHELVLRSVQLAQYENLVSVAQKAKTVKHSLSQLPLELLTHERDLPAFLKQYGGSVSFSVAPFNPPQTVSNPVGNQPSELQFSRMANDNSETSMTAAFDNWQTESGGKIEAVHFTSDKEIDANIIEQTTLLLELRLACLDNTKTEDTTIKRVKPSEILNTLFSAAANGGAYNQGLGHAYGRLKMWESVAGLMNKSMQTDIEDLHAAMDKCLWFEFGSTSSWFYEVAWDAGIVVVGEDRKTINVVAATDTD